eukprot:Blabericola_migrator_1__12918@NODE_84_length_14850_cov_98_458703_g75_i0_p8_GENE_NODE_84_length_14850_cov_98_458703_g75_i0NODE_84_length_14850_cov_98_458703_g75_i0_p8_ORF_typecomplete_len200_score31_12_NODE_84_length_14850_cov_98_458703_g75_i033953994
MHLLWLTSVLILVGGYSTLFDPEATASSDKDHSSIPTGWSVAKSGGIRRPALQVKPLQALPRPVPKPIVITPAMWDDANKFVLNTLSRVVDEVDFGIRLTERDHELDELLNQVRQLTSYVSEFYNELSQRDPLNIMKAWKAIDQQPVESNPNHYILPETKLTTPVPEIYYEIFRAYKDKKPLREEAPLPPAVIHTAFSN